MGEWWRIKERDVLVNKNCPVCPPGAKRENRLNYLWGELPLFALFKYVDGVILASYSGVLSSSLKL